MDLPIGWRLRRPTLDDIDEILTLVHASDVAAVGCPDFSAQDVHEALTPPTVDPRRDSWLALDAAGAIVAWAYLENPAGGSRGFVEVYAFPGRGEPARPLLLDLVLARLGEKAAELGHERMIARAGALPGEPDYVAVLRAAGFEFVKRYARMRRSLAGVAPTPPPPPAGVLIRQLRPEDEADRREFHRILDTAFRDTPDYSPEPYEAWRERIGSLPSVSWDEWFVAEVDGLPAGILQSADQSLDNNEGWVKNLAVLREHRKRGVGRALLTHAFARYAGKGREAAGLGVDLANPTEAYRVYAAVGMTAAYEADMFEREITIGWRPARSLSRAGRAQPGRFCAPPADAPESRERSDRARGVYRAVDQRKSRASEASANIAADITAKPSGWDARVARPRSRPALPPSPPRWRSR